MGGRFDFGGQSQVSQKVAMWAASLDDGTIVLERERVCVLEVFLSSHPPLYMVNTKCGDFP